MIAAFVRFDLMSWFLRRQALLVLAFVVLIGVLLPVPGMAIMTAALATSLMISTPFLGDERGRLDVLYGVLPISRSTVVVGRVLSIVVYYLAAAALATAVTLVMATVRGSVLDAGLLLTVHAAAFAFVGVTAVLQFPVFFRIGYTRGRLMSYAPALVTVGVLWLLQATESTDAVASAAAGISPPVVVGGCVALGVVGLIVAAAVSSRLYRTREI
ncbi:ABC-2 transporter permease [Labedella endophytica]|uniref:ABC-2 transporter permease n=1 Tax=Labedella endophytica TaxID=1523160 RepID=A0A433JUJ9_9MICO|nr:ABC-2 transporter permease [Labedella endophytica]RUR01831.1 hypothetical protein ELQ94_10305 [Labedella endophytica]